MNINQDTNIDDLILIKYLKSIDSPFLPKISEVYNNVKDILNNRIQHIFPNYTLHNIEHSFRIMEYMSKLVDDYRKLNELEVVLLVYSALLHDIGMATSESDINNIKSDNFPFCEIKYSSMKKIVGDDDNLAIQEYIRRIHSSLSKKYILENLKKDMVIPNLPSLDFANELALICQSHTEDHDWIKSNLKSHEVRGDYSFNSQFIAIILRLADILDIDGNRTPHNLYKLISPKGISDDEWKQHFVIFNNEKIILNEKTNQKKITFHGKANNPSIHRKILTYISWVGDELTNALSTVNGMANQYSLFYDASPEINIQTEGYSFSDYKMTLEFRAISALLMGEKIYGDKSLGLRELIQNSIDACKLRQENEDSETEFGDDNYSPRIKVILNKDKNQVLIKDNGIGMSLDVIKKHFLNIGVSYYNSIDFKLKDFNYKPIGNFGIGFLSCFMLSNDVKVITRYYKSKDKYLIELEKGNEWTSLTHIEDVEFEGTEVILNYDNFLNIFNNDVNRIKDFLNTFFITDGVKIELIDKQEKKITEIVNTIDLPKLDKGLFAINLENYLNDIEGYVLIKKKREFIRKFEDIDFIGKLYVYDEEKALTIVDNFNNFEINNYIIDNEISYIVIPLIESENVTDFKNGMKFTDDDVSEVIEKLADSLIWISILVDKENQKYINEDIINENDNILENLVFDDLVALGHDKSCPTKVEIRKITIFEGIKNELYLPFNTKNTHRFSALFFTKNRSEELFIRNVLIKDFMFNIPVIATIFDVEKIFININSRKFIPDISRNNLDKEQVNLINSLVSKAIHKGAIDVLNLEGNEIITLNEFTSNFYSNKNEFEK